ncbi:MAG TPA: FecR domain-containing protein, partial [Verrucomicrobiae bacterium]|nr:FecR domain-containing protein [Verrucomicrobiae bacterium]
VSPPVETTPLASDAWRSGRLAYNNAALADVIADINRYYAPSARLADPSAAEMRVTASFRVNEIPAFIDALQATIPVSVQRDGDGAYVISDARASTAP